MKVKEEITRVIEETAARLKIDLWVLHKIVAHKQAPFAKLTDPLRNMRFPIRNGGNTDFGHLALREVVDIVSDWWIRENLPTMKQIENTRFYLGLCS